MQDCKSLVDTFAMVCGWLTVPLAEKKSVGPVQKLIFLGYEVDYVSMSVRIPLHKIKELNAMLLGKLF